MRKNLRRNLEILRRSRVKKERIGFRKQWADQSVVRERVEHLINGKTEASTVIEKKRREEKKGGRKEEGNWWKSDKSH